MTSVMAVKPEVVTEVRPEGLPEGFISIKELNENYPGFRKTYLNAIGEDKPMKIWFDEDHSIFAELAMVEIVEDIDGTIDKETGLVYTTKEFSQVNTELAPRTEHTIDIKNFFRLFGDPKERFDLKLKQASNRKKPKRWQALKANCLENVRRTLSRQPSSKFVPDEHGNTVEMKLGCTYTTGTYQEHNSDSGNNLWGIFPKVWVLPPDRFEMTVKGTVKETTFEDYVWEAMKTSGMKLDKNLSGTATKQTMEEIQKVKSILVSSGHVKDTTSFPRIKNYMMAAQEDYVVEENTELQEE